MELNKFRRDKHDKNSKSENCKVNFMKSFSLLIKREYWENKSLKVIPITLLFLFVLGQIFTYFFVINNSSVRVDVNVANLALKKSNQFYLAATFIILSIHGFLYILSSLYAERKDNSILFWKSLPFSDIQIVSSKLLVAMINMGLSIVISYICIFVSFLLIGISSKFGLLFDNLLLITKDFLVLMLIILPVFCWGLFVSSFSDRNPFVIAVLAPALLWLSLKIFNVGEYIANIMFQVFLPIKYLFYMFMVKNWSKGFDNLIDDNFKMNIINFSDPNLYFYFGLGVLFYIGAIYFHKRAT